MTTYDIDEVKQGLAEGKSFRREFGNPPSYGGIEYVCPTTPGRFEHTVASVDSGGVAELDISVIDKNTWPQDNWELDS